MHSLARGCYPKSMVHCVEPTPNNRQVMLWPDVTLKTCVRLSVTIGKKVYTTKSFLLCCPSVVLPVKNGWNGTKPRNSYGQHGVDPSASMSLNSFWLRSTLVAGQLWCVEHRSKGNRAGHGLTCGMA